VGHGPLQAGLNQLVCERGLSSYVLITQGTGTSYYPLFDCFVQPSFTEGLSMALLEAMFFKVPVLVSSSTGEHDVVCNGKNGYLFKPTDLATLIKHVEHIMQDQILKKQLADRAYEYVHSQYALEHVIKAYRSVLDSLI
jgi:glycosyltransferase involved in cell wall biosynthesis